jgi:serine/threonine-protein kinase
VTAEHAFVRAEPWKGAAPGPDRPWLIMSRASAFVGAQPGGAREHVLLRSVGEAVAHGTVFWQGSNDAFEVPHFTAVDDTPPANNPRPDLRRQWLEIWGVNHFRNPTGPGTGKLGAPSSVRFAEKLRPGEVAPRDLVLEFRDRRTAELGADPKVLKLAVPPTGLDRPK